MALLMEIDPKTKQQMTEVRSCCGEPPGVYIGSENNNGRMYHYYQKGSEFFYENDYSREVRAKEKERRRLKWAWKNRDPSNG